MATVRLELVNDPVDAEAIDVWVDGLVGDVPVRFRLDTGAGRCTVPLVESTQRLTVTGVDKGVALSGMGLGDDEVVVPSLRLGDLVIEDVAATRSVAGSPLSPLLGMTALGRFRCEFRFSESQLELDGRTTLDTGDWFELTSHVGTQPMVPVDFETVVALACWDTGAGLTAVDVDFADSHPHLFEHVRATRGVDASGVEIPSQLCRMAAFRVGGIAIKSSACAVVDFGPHNATLEQPISFVLGMPAIVQADWSFDFPQRRWSVHQP
jgi:Aspartyl protease